MNFITISKRLLPAMALLTQIGMAQNPVIQSIFSADPAPMVYKDTVFLYVGHDEDNAPENKYLMRDYRLFSTTDMVNWTDRGTPLKITEFAWTGMDANAAQCMERNGKFYWYISTGDKTDTGVSIGVAVSDKPTGPFKNALGHSLIKNSQTTYAKHGWDDLDPTVYIDDDGQAYLTWGNNACYWVKLNDDMISYSGRIHFYDIDDKREFGPDFEEAPWTYKRNGKYYLLYASGFPENIRYAMSNGPIGPWKYQGILMDRIPQKSGTNHPGIIDFKGNSYFFYHKAVEPNGHDKRRSVCVEPFTYNADGTIPTIKPTNEGVLKAVQNLNPFVRTEAETMAWGEGIETESLNESSVVVTDIDNGDYLKIRSVDFESGAKTFSALVSSVAKGGIIDIRLDSKNGASIGKLSVGNTSGKWKTVSTFVKTGGGVHDLYIVFSGKSSAKLFKFDSWFFQK
jgi:arabinoxylan arabinofuranohydrolase